MTNTKKANIIRMQSPRRRRFAVSSSFLFALILLLPRPAKTQHLSGSRRKTDSLPVPMHTVPSDAAIESRLVTLALQGPTYDAMGHRIEVAKSQLDLARRAWLNLLTFSLNYNDQTFAHQQNAAYVYPKYFVGLVIPIGMFFQIGPSTHAARENVKVAQDNQQEEERNLRMEVLSKYRTYKNYEALILLQNTIVVDHQAALTQIEQKFRDGLVSIDQFNLANKAYSDEKAKLLNLQLQQDLERLDVERIIGTSLDSVIK